MAKKSSIYLSDSLRAKLRCPPRGQSRAVSETVDRYYTLIEPERKRLGSLFAEGEWNAMRNACNGTIWTGATIRGGVLLNIQDSLNAELEQYGADRAALEGKLAGLSVAQQFALVEELDAWWEQYGPVEEEPDGAEAY